MVAAVEHQSRHFPLQGKKQLASFIRQFASSHCLEFSRAVDNRIGGQPRSPPFQCVRCPANRNGIICGQYLHYVLYEKPGNQFSGSRHLFGILFLKNHELSFAVCTIIRPVMSNDIGVQNMRAGPKFDPAAQFCFETFVGSNICQLYLFSTDQVLRLSNMFPA